LLVHFHCFVTLYHYNRFIIMHKHSWNTKKHDETARIASIRNGDVSVFSAIYEAYWDEIFGFIARKCSNHSLAEDLASDVFYKAFKNIESCCKAKSPNIRARLYSIARNRVIDEFKRSKSSQLHSEIPLQSNEPNQIDTITTSLLAQQVLEFLKTLWDDVYELFVLRFRQQLTYQEIATINWKSVDNNKKIYSRTAKKIAKHFSSFTLTHE